MKYALALILALGVTAAASAADTVRICTYNILKFSQANEDGRIPHFARILDSIRPHVLVCQEVEDASTGPRFVSDVLTWAPFASTTFIDGPDSDHLVFYDQSMFDLVSTRVIPTELRNILEVVLALRPHDATVADTVVLYSLHLKAQDNSADAQQRLREVTAMINAMSTRERIIVCGDLNIYSPSEPSYLALVGPAAVRPFVDPLGTSWRRNTAAFAEIYTQCPRKTQLSGCGGGVDGGIDDRFDLILPSAALSSRLIGASYTAFGNDGVARLNESIDEPTNTRVSAEMAAALKCASDHLPLFADVILGDIQAGVDSGDDRLRFTASWSAPSLTLRGTRVDGTYRIVSVDGSVHATIKATSDVTTVHLTDLASGTYHVTGPNGYDRFVVIR
jgi:endonuclease/exonuclease/phosphatase family metal-dependent hydrolase